MVKKSPESLLSYNRKERTFCFNNKLYTIRTVERVYIIGNEDGVDKFYFKVTSPYMNYPEQVSIYTSRCKLPAVEFYLSRLNSIIYGEIPERWLEIWIIALFKNVPFLKRVQKEAISFQLKLKYFLWIIKYHLTLLMLPFFTCLIFSHFNLVLNFLLAILHQLDI